MGFIRWCECLAGELDSDWVPLTASCVILGFGFAFVFVGCGAA